MNATQKKLILFAMKPEETERYMMTEAARCNMDITHVIHIENHVEENVSLAT